MKNLIYVLQIRVEFNYMFQAAQNLKQETIASKMSKIMFANMAYYNLKNSIISD